MLTLHKRLDYQKDEVLKVCENFGIWRAMTQFHVAGYTEMKNWLKETTGNENFGLHPKINLGNSQTLGDQIIEAMLRKVSDLEKNNQDLRERNRFLEWQLAQGQAKETEQAISILEVCK